MFSRKPTAWLPRGIERSEPCVVSRQHGEARPEPEVLQNREVKAIPLGVTNKMDHRKVVYFVFRYTEKQK